MAGGDQHALAAVGGRSASRSPSASQASRIGSGRDVHMRRTSPSRSIGVAGLGLHQIEDVVEAETVRAVRSGRTACRGRSRSAARVFAGRCRADGSATPATWPARAPSQLLARVRPRGQARVHRRQTPGVGFDNVHAWPGVPRTRGTEGAVAVVTGASSGIGEATAVAFAQPGRQGRAGRAPQRPARRAGRPDRTAGGHRARGPVRRRRPRAGRGPPRGRARGLRRLRRPRQQRRRPRRRRVREPHVRADRAGGPREPPRRDVRHPGVLAGAARTGHAATS